MAPVRVALLSELTVKVFGSTYGADGAARS
jgi:hypothetical protein